MSRWPPERVEELKRLWGDGMSASQIAIKFGDISLRNAVIGKVFRLKLTRLCGVTRPRWTHARRTSAKKIAAGKRADDRTRMRARRTVETKPLPPRRTPAAAIPKPESKRLTLADLHERMCKYIEDDVPPFTYCGADAELGSPWCSFHRQLCVAATVSRKEANTHFDRIANG